MKTKSRKLLEKILRYISAKILKKYNPDIIGITGSLGKTTTKEAIKLVLATTYNVRASFKNYNNEVGLPLTIIGSMNPGRSLLKWIGVFIKALTLIFIKDKKYPEILILEMASSHPGDIDYLLQFVKPQVSVITSVAPVHIEFFENLENIEKEKSQLVSALPEDGLAVLNGDDPRVLKMQKLTRSKIMTFGFLDHVNFQASQVSIINQNDLFGLQFTVKFLNTESQITLKNVVSEPIIYSLLAALAVGDYYDLTLMDIQESLKGFLPPPGRMRLLKGIKNSIIIDDSYNSSPFAAKVALRVLSRFPKVRGTSYAVLGDMLELGQITETAHQELGSAVVDYHIDYLVTVGEIARDIARGAKAAGMPEDKIFSFGKCVDAAKFLQDKIHTGDIILVKGSQEVRTEKIVKEIMAEPERASELLARQEKSWG